MWNCGSGTHVRPGHECVRTHMRHALHSRFQNSLGILYDSIGDNAAALKYYQLSIAKNPTSAAAIINTAKVMNSQSRFREAENLCLEAIRVDPQVCDGRARPCLCVLSTVSHDARTMETLASARCHACCVHVRICCYRGPRSLSSPRA